MTIAVIYGGTRQNGNTEILTEQAVQGLDVERIYLKDYQIQPVKDQRHTRDGFQEINDDYNLIIDRVLRHDILVFSTPIYWYSMSGIMKNFIDRWSQTLRDPKYPDFKARMSAKQAYVITVGGDEPYLKGLPLIRQFEYIFDFIGIPFAGYILGNGNKPGEIFQDKEALFAASQLQKKLNHHAEQV
ncbi:flavodoxin family protein [Paenactinomyces guangxiensis]|uniref:Flavodoxin family protein n=1 Tax=Paenactinomyces guangxiensis TaxID=1490290 RepID=A0A7W1WT55_9BACL|nr:flavodoxin family protein [Paenactinomyces guangxiensis]MBA4495564.1 flavodoxin family protein [Paenactinomyces guangxiensis]MBH8592822.1 flavodoxin family protein [Paenactinomyces guangxiensis]